MKNNTMSVALKRRSAAFWRFITLVLLGIFIGILAASKMEIFFLLVGPQELDLRNPEKMVGKYVYYDAWAVLGSFSGRYSGDKQLNASYAIYDYDADAGFAIKRKGNEVHDRHQEMEAISTAFWDYLEGNLRSKPEPVRISGTWEALDASTLRHFKVWWGEPDDDLLPYTINEGSVMGMKRGTITTMTTIALLFFIAAFWAVLKMIQGKFRIHQEEFMKIDSEGIMAAIEQDFNSARQIGKAVWVGHLYTVYMSGTAAFTIENKKVVWAYFDQANRKSRTGHLRLYDTNQDCRMIRLKETEAYQMLKEFADYQPHIIVEYSLELEALFNKDFNKFLSICYDTSEAIVTDS